MHSIYKRPQRSRPGITIWEYLLAALESLRLTSTLTWLALLILDGSPEIHSLTARDATTSGQERWRPDRCIFDWEVYPALGEQHLRVYKCWLASMRITLKKPVTTVLDNLEFESYLGLFFSLQTYFITYFCPRLRKNKCRFSPSLLQQPSIVHSIELWCCFLWDLPPIWEHL